MTKKDLSLANGWNPKKEDPGNARMAASMAMVNVDLSSTLERAKGVTRILIFILELNELVCQDLTDPII